MNVKTTVRHNRRGVSQPNCVSFGAPTVATVAEEYVAKSIFYWLLISYEVVMLH